MPKLFLLLLSILLLALRSDPVPGQNPSGPQTFDVLHYAVRLEPDLLDKSITGTVLIRFVARTDHLSLIEFDCGELVINAVREGGTPLKFEKQGRRLKIILPQPASRAEHRAVEITYHGAPRFGMKFFPEREQVYTEFSTSQWMVCIDAPDDRATLRLTLILPAGLTAVANGKQLGLAKMRAVKITSVWDQEKPVPTYTFGFAAGRYSGFTKRSGRTRFRYLAQGFSREELGSIFSRTPDMLRFYERRSGVRYSDPSYTQVLAAGAVAQEMSGFTVIRETYGREVMRNGKGVWLEAHEFAHQWWGNMVTCQNWGHFWLNEGMASFMAAAYLEHRYGREAYLREISEYSAKYQRVRSRGNDRALVFQNWSHPSADDRSIVYNKGAYVMHLLREEMGEGAFWSGLRYYTRKFYGKSVTTADFQRAMEDSSRKDLSTFFARWVYSNGVVGEGSKD